MRISIQNLKKYAVKRNEDQIMATRVILSFLWKRFVLKRGCLSWQKSLVENVII